MKQSKGGAICISWGKYGGFYFRRGFTIRLCLGWVAFTYFPEDIDTILNQLLKKENNLSV